ARDACVADERVDLAELVLAARDERGGVLGIGDVGCERERAPPGGGDRGDDGLRARGVGAVVDADRGARGGEPERPRAAHAARRSAARAVSGLWKPPETLSLIVRRAPAASAAVISAATPSSVPLTTTCPGQLKFAAQTPSMPSQRRSISASPRPITAAIAPGV